MKSGIHPVYNELNVICACGHTFKTRSTHKGDIRVEICSSCHPFFTGKQKLVDTAGRVERFEKRYKATRGARNRPHRSRPQPQLDALLGLAPGSPVAPSKLRRASRAGIPESGYWRCGNENRTAGSLS